MISKLKKRPAEAVSGIALAYLVFEFLAEHGVSDPLSALVGVAVGFLPATVSEIVDLIRK